MSGLIYAVIVAAWAAVLVPRWIRRNEEIERANEADAVRGVRVLERRAGGAIRGGQVSDAAVALGGAGPGHVQLTQDVEPAGSPPDDSPLPPEEVAATPGSPPLPTFARAAQRRRRVLGVLAVCVAGAGGAVVAGVVPAPVVAIPGALLGGFLVLARRAARAEAEQRVRARRARAAAAHRTEEVAGEGASASDRPAKRIAVFEPESIPVTNPYAWNPVAVPRPTYLNKAKANAPAARTVDLTSPGSWTSGRLNPTTSLAPPQVNAEDVMRSSGSAEEAEPFEQRRAVGD